ncbi:MAG: CDGSH iron-sulfur domain-containing protein [Acidobacteria bacterium]|nr:MAG: CDGSH iron-sulfur domain-containing protein [Acidobacteriota bacterium]
MPEPRIAGRRPAVLELQPGTYHWCTCGKSAGQPFCDGSHAGTEFRPLRFTIEEPRRVALCQCKRTHDAPFCDGAHSTIP